jgi:hypothetical protein
MEHARMTRPSSTSSEPTPRLRTQTAGRPESTETASSATPAPATAPHAVGLDDAPLPFADLPAPRAPAGPRETDTVAAHEAKGDRRAPDTIWRRNPRDQGMIGFTDAMAYFGARGYDICVPLIDNQPYDLVIDDGARLQKVQVKTTTFRRQRFVVQLATHGGNQSFHTRKAFEPSLCDLLYVLTDAWERYVIPTSAITARSSLTLGARMEPFRV